MAVISTATLIGVGLSATMAAVASAAITGMVIGAVIGGITAAVTGGNILKGMVMGGIIGGVTAGALAGMESIGSGAASTASSTASAPGAGTGAAGSSSTTAYGGLLSGTGAQEAGLVATPTLAGSGTSSATLSGGSSVAGGAGSGAGGGITSSEMLKVGMGVVQEGAKAIGQADAEKTKASALLAQQEQARKDAIINPVAGVNIAEGKFAKESKAKSSAQVVATPSLMDYRNLNAAPTVPTPGQPQQVVPGQPGLPMNQQGAPA